MGIAPTVRPLFLLCAAFAASASGGRAAAGPGGLPDTPKSDGGAGDRSRELARLVDPIVGEQLGHGKAAGAVVVVVMEGEVALAKGYGFADREAGRPMTADATLVHVGSISKL